MPPDNIIVNLANKKIDQSLSDFQNDIIAGADATLDTEQLISHIRASLVDTSASWQDSDGGDISVSKVYELVTKIYNILDRDCLSRLVIQHVF